MVGLGEAGGPWPGEQRASHRGLAGLQYWRAGAPGAPVLVFLPGGGHLARVAYGVDGADRSHFLDHWLALEGWGLLALSYPTDHPDVGTVAPELTLKEWTAWVAAATGDALRASPDREVYVALWSMAGRSCNALSAAFRDRGQRLDGMISLAATPPFDGLLKPAPGGEPLMANGLWAIGPANGAPNNRYVLDFLAGVAAQEARTGAKIFPDGEYLRKVLCNTPIMLRGTPQRVRNGRSEWDPAAAAFDLEINNAANFPLAGSVAPTEPEDGVHALTDAAAWAMVTAQAIRARWEAAARPENRWTDLVSLASAAAGRLTRTVSGGHFFFIGAEGARATAIAIRHVANELHRFDEDVQSILASRPYSFS